MHYSLSLHLFLGLVSYLMVWGYDYGDRKLKEVPALFKATRERLGTKSLVTEIFCFTILGPFSLVAFLILKKFKLR